MSGANDLGRFRRPAAERMRGGNTILYFRGKKDDIV